jgi:hypothetical protein
MVTDNSQSTQYFLTRINAMILGDFLEKKRKSISLKVSRLAPGTQAFKKQKP